MYRGKYPASPKPPGPRPYVSPAPGGKLGGKPRSGDQLTIPAPNDSLIFAPVNLKIVEANEWTLTASGDSCDELKQRSRRDRRDSPQPHLEGVQRRLEPETGMVCRAVRRRLEVRTMPRQLGNTPW